MQMPSKQQKKNINLQQKEKIEPKWKVKHKI